MFGRRKPVAYYAHSLRIYGTKLERKQGRRIRRCGYKVVNPNGLLSEATWKDDAVRLILDADVVICTEYQQHIGRGVAWELEYAFGLHKPVFVLRGRSLIPLKPSSVVVLGLDWAIRWARIV
jgi:hypothetical protein